MVKLLVTGGLGFIGSNFIRATVNRTDPYDVLNLDARFYGSNPRNLVDIRKSSRYRFVKANVSNAKALKKLARHVDVIVHFAAETHVDRSISDPKRFMRTNVLGTLNLLEAARVTRVRKFVHVSTDEVYGSTVGSTSFVEEDRLNPSSPYAASKAAAEMLVKAYHSTYALPTCILRCTNNFGPYQFPEKFIPKAIVSCLSGRNVPIYGNGKQIRDWIYVEDFCAAVESAINRGPAGSTFNVSAGNEYRNIDVAKLILQQLGKPTTLLHFVEDRPGHDYRYSLDSTRIRTELGWKPLHNFAEALGESVRWYAQNESWWKPLLDNKILSPTPWRERW